jgi:hypothetical protein
MDDFAHMQTEMNIGVHTSTLEYASTVDISTTSKSP